MKLEGEKFSNGATCEGVVFADESLPLDMASIDINGRYPEKGWAINHSVHEIVKVVSGVGSLAIKGAEPIQLITGNVVSVAPQTHFAWSGEMNLLMVCSPPFNPEQYKVEDDDEI
jgi:mannose-6-phosphate isomerase-like protein (cupin superfamily)